MAKQRLQEDPAERKEFFREVIPLVRFLGGPDNLFGILMVAESVEPVLELFWEIASEETKERVQPIIKIVRDINRGRIHIPASVNRDQKRAKSQKTLKGYYDNNPHYSVYRHQITTHELQPPYLALLASLIPVWIRLEAKRKEDPSNHWGFAYETGLALRKLTLGEWAGNRILIEFPDKARVPLETFNHLTRLLDRYHLDTSVTGENRWWIKISRVLEWYHKGTRGNGTRRSGGSAHSAGHLRIHGSSGAIETETRESKIFLPVDDANSFEIRGAEFFPHSRSVEYHQEEAFDRNLKLDVKPVGMTLQLQPPRQTAYFLENRRRAALRNSTYAIQAIEMRNQHLPVGRNRLTGYELECFLKALLDCSAGVWDHVPERERGAISAWAACRFYLSRNESAIRHLVVSSERKTPFPHIQWLPRTGKLILPVSSPEHASPDEDIRGKLTVPVEEWLSIEPKGTFQTCLTRLPARPGKLFAKSYETEFAMLLKQLNTIYRIDLTPHRLTHLVRDTISHLAPADEVMGQYFAGQPPNLCIPAVYSVIPQERLRALFAESCRIVDHRASLETELLPAPHLPLLISDDDHHVGSLHVPRPQIIRETIRGMQRKLSAQKDQAVPSWIETHNLFTAYVTFFLLSVSGVRLLSTLLPAIFDLDPASGCCFVSDKDDSGYSSARLVWLPDRLRAQIDAYLEHTVKVRQHLALSNASQLTIADARLEVSGLSSFKMPQRDDDLEILDQSLPLLFMVSQTGATALRVMPNLLIEHVGIDWKLRIMSLRHYVRSHLSRAGVSGELINAFMGHAERGQEPWGPYSTLPPRLWKEAINYALTPLLDDFGLRVISSPLIGRTS